MARPYLIDFDPKQVPSPCFVVDQGAVKRNLKILATVQDKTDCHILLALKGFAMTSLFPLIKRYLPGVCASSPDEARLGRDYFGGEVHSHGPAFSEADLMAHLNYCDHLVFNSFSQWKRFQGLVQASQRPISCGLRVNPEHSETSTAIYDPCRPGSRLGITKEQFTGQDLIGIEGLHFHTLCEKGADALLRTAEVFEAKFKEFLPAMRWLNMGGGHLITAPSYDQDMLCGLINHFRKTYDLQVYLEPGEAIAINTGALVCTVLDIINNNGLIAILDCSVACHLPDVLEMPYRPEIRGAGKPGKLAHDYTLGGVSCLAGDILGEYSFSKPLKIGERLIIEDMSHYTMVKTTTFNGVRLPSIAIFEPEKNKINLIKKFTFAEYLRRLG